MSTPNDICAVSMPEALRGCSRRYAAQSAWLVVFLTAIAFGISACSTSKSDVTDGKSPEVVVTAPSTTLPAAKVTSTVRDGATDVAITLPVGVTVEHGTITTIAVRRGADSQGVPEPGPGALNAQKTGWLSPSDFAPHTPYRIDATVTGVDGKSTEHVWNFTTGAATTEIHTDLNVGDGSTYGVGMPIILKLNTPAPSLLHEQVTDRLKVTSEPAVTGGWRWFSDTELHYRPAEFWPAQTKVSLNIDMAGLHFGNGIWGVDGRTVNFAIGDSHISEVDAASHMMTVKINGEAVNTFPISTGRPGPTTETRSGIHVVNEKSPLVVMDSSTIGIPVNSPGGYKIDAEWSVRISNSGEFVHSAPWSVGSQGYANVSHGCVNASPSNAKWFFDQTLIGDVVQVINTPRVLEPWNGYGDWQIPWDQWVN